MTENKAALSEPQAQDRRAVLLFSIHIEAAVHFEALRNSQFLRGERR
jgi:hypothetical protein